MRDRGIVQAEKEPVMARLVKRYRNQPHTVILAGESLSICGCGLSAKQPYCDGTHNTVNQ